MKIIRNSLAVLGFIFILFLVWARVQGQEKPVYQPSETQSLRLKVKQLEFETAQEHYQAAIGAFNAEIKAVEKENGWQESDVQFHPDTLTFTAVEKRPAPPMPSNHPLPTPPVPAEKAK